MAQEEQASATVGQQGLRVPRVGLGTGLHGEVSEAQSVATIEHALGRGVRFFDTAPLYGNGLAEERLGIALRGVPRDSYVLNTKVGILSGGVTGGFDYDFSAAGVQRCFERSLRRLGTERIDVLHLHEPEGFAEQVLSETLPLVAGWREQGLIRAVSAGVNHWHMVEPFVQHLDCVLLAGRYTLLEQTALPFLQRQRQARRPVLGAGIFNSGILATGPRDGARYNYASAPPAAAGASAPPAGGVHPARRGTGPRRRAVCGGPAGHRRPDLRRLQPRRVGPGPRRHPRRNPARPVDRITHRRPDRPRRPGSRVAATAHYAWRPVAVASARTTVLAAAGASAIMFPVSDFDYGAARQFQRRKDEMRRAALGRRLHTARCDFDRIVNMVVERYHPGKIYQWGSLLDPRTFAEWSDIDIAVEGITSGEQFLALYREACELTSFEVDLVQLEQAYPSYASAIRERGRLIYERK